MKITAMVRNSPNSNKVTVTTGEESQTLEIPSKRFGSGSAVSGGEFLMLALATSFCNAVYREAAKRNIVLESVEAIAEAEFGGPGEPASLVHYRARVEARASEEQIVDLIRHTDRVSEIQNSLRVAVPVALERAEGVARV